MSNNKNKRPIRIQNKNYVVLDKTDIYWKNNEYGATVVVVQDDSGNKKLATITHGAFYFETPQFLKNKIKEYKLAIKNSERLLTELDQTL